MDEKMTNLFEQAYSNPELKRRLLHDPREVAAEFKVEFKADEIEQLQKLGGLMDLADEIKTGRLYPRPPIFYPMHVWQIQELLDIFTRLLPGSFGPGPIFYPAQEFGSQTMAFSAHAFNPGWVSYRGEDFTGGGSASRWVIPGPIFYPASLRNLMKERLVQILQVQQG
jgi:hypothetical protein